MLPIGSFNFQLLDFCVDVDECAATNDCAAEAICLNNDGSYSCICRDGFAGKFKIKWVLVEYKKTKIIKFIDTVYLLIIIVVGCCFLSLFLMQYYYILFSQSSINSVDKALKILHFIFFHRWWEKLYGNKWMRIKSMWSINNGLWRSHQLLQMYM